MFVFRANRRLFDGSRVDTRPTTIEVVLIVVGVASLILGWYFNIRYVQQFGSEASWVHFTKSLFSNWAANSAAQDYIIANVLLFPIWTILDGRRRGIRVPWGFFVMSLVTSFGFSVAAYLLVVERQIRYDAVTAIVQPVDRNQG